MKKVLLLQLFILILTANISYAEKFYTCSDFESCKYIELINKNFIYNGDGKEDINKVKVKSEVYIDHAFVERNRYVKLYENTSIEKAYEYLNSVHGGRKFAKTMPKANTAYKNVDYTVKKENNKVVELIIREHFRSDIDYVYTFKVKGNNVYVSYSMESPFISYNCGLQNLTKVEKMICDNNIKEDMAIHNLYNMVMQNYSYGLDQAQDDTIKETTKKKQIAWLKERNKCDSVECIKKAYQKQISFLQSEANMYILNKQGCNVIMHENNIIGYNCEVRASSMEDVYNIIAEKDWPEYLVLNEIYKSGDYLRNFKTKSYAKLTNEPIFYMGASDALETFEKIVNNQLESIIDIDFSLNQMDISLIFDDYVVISYRIYERDGIYYYTKTFYTLG